MVGGITSNLTQSGSSRTGSTHVNAGVLSSQNPAELLDLGPVRE